MALLAVAVRSSRRHDAIVVARQHDVHAEARLEHGLEATRDVERHLLLERAAGAAHAGVVAAVSRIDHDRLKAAFRDETGWRATGAGGAADDSGAWLGAAMSITTRAAVSVFEVAARTSPADGARPIVMVAGGRRGPA